MRVTTTLAGKYNAIKSERLYEQIVEQIEQQILTGDLKAGDQLPTERYLAERFRVSRTAVREAMKALAENGLVAIRPGRGTFVVHGTSQAVRHSLSLTMAISEAAKSADVIQVREILEPEIAALAAQNATEGQIAMLHDAVAIMDGALEDMVTLREVYLQADVDFHLTLAHATQNALLPILFDPVFALLEEQRRCITAPAGPVRGQYHHGLILDAVVRRDPDAAREAMRAHLRQVREDINASLSERS